MARKSGFERERPWRPSSTLFMRSLAGTEDNDELVGCDKMNLGQHST